MEPGFLAFSCLECQNVVYHAYTASPFQPHSEVTEAAPQAPEDGCRMCLHFFLGIELVFLSLLLKNGDLETFKDDQGQVQSMQKLFCSVLETRLSSES